MVAQVEAFTGGTGIDFAIDGVGGDRLRNSIACVQANGTAASIGQAAGDIPDMSIADFAPKRAIRFARPSIMTFASDPDAYRHAGEAVFGMIAGGISAEPAQIYPPEQAAEVLADLESGRRTGTRILST